MEPLHENESSLALRNFQPKLKVDLLMRPIHRFMEIEASAGIVLIISTMIALFFANTSLASFYTSIWQTKMTLGFGEGVFELTLLEFINDGLMTLFFFAIGLEIKREFLHGELRALKKASFPIAAALSGMLLSALLYYLMLRNAAGSAGWAIPTATDIAFIVGFLSLFGKRVPVGLKVSLVTIAIASDIGAILAFAVTYTENFSRDYFFMGLGLYFVALAFHSVGVRRIFPYALIGAGMWITFIQAGVQPTLVGMFLALATPARRLLKADDLKLFFGRVQEKIVVEASDRHLDRESIRSVGREVLSPLERLENDLHPWVAFLIVPLFALANAGIALELETFSSKVTWAVILGLLLGKSLGIFGGAWLIQASKVTPYPEGVNTKIFLGASFLSGVGFTLSLFISTLALEGELLTAAKSGVVIGSALSALIGLFLLHRFLERRERYDDKISPEGPEYRPS